MSNNVSCLVKVLSVSILALLVICFVCSSFPTAKAEDRASEGEKWAIIIGVTDYKGDYLTGANNSAKDIYNLIVPIYGEDHVKLLLDSTATKSNINNTIYNWLAPLEDANDTVLFYFAVHGYNGTDIAPFDEADNIDEYLCPYGASSVSSCIRDDELKVWLNVLDSEKVVVILDTCFAGGFIQDLGKSGRTILASSAEHESSWFGLYNHGFFSHYLIQALGTQAGTANLNSDNFLSVEELFAYAESKTVALGSSYPQYLQHPQFYDGYPGEFPLIPLATPDNNTHLVTFTQTGLPSGATWSVTFNGVTKTTNGSSITFSVANGTYSYSLNLPSGYKTSSSTGSLEANADKKVSFTVSPVSSTSALAYPTSLSLVLVVIGALTATIVTVSAVLIVRRQRGQSMLPPPPPTYIPSAVQRFNCMFCGQENNAYATFCITCGKQLRDPLTQQPAAVMPEVQQNNNCVICGKENNVFANFCNACGNKIK